jgi:hypothetical protein
MNKYAITIMSMDQEEETVSIMEANSAKEALRKFFESLASIEEFFEEDEEVPEGDMLLESEEEYVLETKEYWLTLLKSPYRYTYKEENWFGTIKDSFGIRDANLNDIEYMFYTAINLQEVQNKITKLMKGEK